MYPGTPLSRATTVAVIALGLLTFPRMVREGVLLLASAGRLPLRTIDARLSTLLTHHSFSRTSLLFHFIFFSTRAPFGFDSLACLVR